MAILAPTSSSLSKDSSYSFSLHIQSSTIFGSKLKSGEFQQTRFRLFSNSNSYPGLTIKASRESLGLTQELKSNKLERAVETEDGSDLFEDMKHRFLSFKKHKYLENLEHYQNLAKGQAPKFLVIGCADSRVCPSTILGFQPGEAFMVRNIANLVPPFESGPSETNAALEFSVNSLEVKNILVVGHSCCGGIRALMSMNDEIDKSSFIQSWVVNGKDARLWTKAAASKLSFDQQCKHCEKVTNFIFYVITNVCHALAFCFIFFGYMGTQRAQKKKLHMRNYGPKLRTFTQVVKKEIDNLRRRLLHEMQTQILSKATLG